MRPIIVLLLVLQTMAILAQKQYKLDSLFNHLYQEGSFNGCILIAEKGKIVYQNNLGFANEATKEKLSEKSIFELASVSKQFTAMAIVILKERGKLDYDNKIGKYLPELSFYKNVTIRNLLNHTCGLFDYMELMDSLVIDKKNIKNRVFTNKDVIAAYAKYKPKLNFEPGEKWEYSNGGYVLLASIIEKVSKKSYPDFLKQAIFSPLNMKNTFVYNPKIKKREIKYLVSNYLYSDSLKKFVLPENMIEKEKVYSQDIIVYSFGGIYGDAYVHSTIMDMFKWDRALYINKLVSIKSINEIFNAAKLKNKEVVNYGFGWNIYTKPPYDDKLPIETGKIVNHAGITVGNHTFIERHIETDKTIIALQNHDTEKTKIGLKQIYEILYDAKFKK